MGMGFTCIADIRVLSFFSIFATVHTRQVAGKLVLTWAKGLHLVRDEMSHSSSRDT